MTRIRQCTRSPYCRLKLVIQLSAVGLVVAVSYILATGSFPS